MARKGTKGAGRKYRCFYVQLGKNGVPIPNDSGTFPSVEVEASDAEAAQAAARKLTGCPIESVERIEEVAA